MDTKHAPGHGHGHQHAHAAGGAIDPVCGMQVDPKSAAGAHEHHGVRYHFCSKHCLAQFQADPAKYLAKSSEPAPAPAAARKGAQYTCPMHPEIVRDGPGPAPSAGWRWCRSRAPATRTIPSSAI
jgi:Cu+-exporting ATPase